MFAAVVVGAGFAAGVVVGAAGAGAILPCLSWYIVVTVVGAAAGCSVKVIVYVQSSEMRISTGGNCKVVVPVVYVLICVTAAAVCTRVMSAGKGRARQNCTNKAN